MTTEIEAKTLNDLVKARKETVSDTEIATPEFLA